MKIITPDTLAKNIVESWVEQYGSSKPNVTSSLRSLLRPTPKQIKNIIGNESWTTTTCNQCGAENSPVVHLGDEPDYDSCTFYICLSCITAATKLLHDAGFSSPEGK